MPTGWSRVANRTSFAGEHQPLSTKFSETAIMCLDVGVAETNTAQNQTGVKGEGEIQKTKALDPYRSPGSPIKACP